VARGERVGKRAEMGRETGRGTGGKRRETGVKGGEIKGRGERLVGRGD